MEQKSQEMEHESAVNTKRDHFDYYKQPKV